MKRVYIANDAITANLLKARLEDAGIQAIVQDERTHELRGEVPLVYPSVWVDNRDEHVARKIALELEHPQYGTSWDCKECGEVLDSSFSDCWKCAQSPPEEQPARPAPASRKSDKKFFPLIGAVALLCLLGILFGVYKAYKYQSFADHFEAAYRHQTAERFDQAIKEYDLALAVDPTRTDALMNRGSAWYSKEDYDRAIQDFDAVVKLNPRTEGAFHARGTANYALGHLSKAMQDYLAALSAKPYDENVKFGVIAVKYEYGNLDGALQDAESLRNSKLYGVPAARFRAHILFEQGKTEKALAEANLAISLDPKNSDALCTKASVLLSLGEFERALEVCGMARKLSGGTPFYEKLIRGAVFYRQEKIADSHNLMQDVLKLTSKRREDLTCICTAYLILGNETEARKTAEEMLKRSPEDRYSYYHAAQVAFWFSRKGDAEVREQGAEQAIAFLAEAKRHGFIAWFNMKNDLFLKDLLDHPRYKKLAGLP